MVNRAQSQDSVFCAFDGCTRSPLLYSRYCQFCQRKGAKRDYEIQALAHRQSIHARRQVQANCAPEPWKVLYAYCRPSDGRYGATYTYAIGVGRFVKFGQAQDVEGRLMNLQIGSPHRLRLLAKVRSSRELEHHIHNGLKQFSHRGEWFHLNETTRQLIRLMKANDVVGVCKLISELLQGSFCLVDANRNDLHIYDQNTVIV